MQATNEAPAIGFRTQATLANKWIARAPRVSAPSDHKHSKDLQARPDRVYPDQRAAQREAVEMNACVTVIRKKGRGPRTQATMANKWISRALRVLAHSDDKHSQDLPARQDQILPDTRAAQREAVEMNACVTVIGGKGRLPPGRRVPEWRGGGVRWGGAASPPAAEWRGGGGPGKRAASPPAAGWRGRGGTRGGAAPPPVSFSGTHCVACSLNDGADLLLSTDASLTASGAARGRLPTGCWVAG